MKKLFVETYGCQMASLLHAPGGFDAELAPFGWGAKLMSGLGFNSIEEASANQYKRLTNPPMVPIVLTGFLKYILKGKPFYF